MDKRKQALYHVSEALKAMGGVSAKIGSDTVIESSLRSAEYLLGQIVDLNLTTKIVNAVADDLGEPVVKEFVITNLAGNSLAYAIPDILADFKLLAAENITVNSICLKWQIGLVQLRKLAKHHNLHNIVDVIEDTIHSHSLAFNGSVLESQRGIFRDRYDRFIEKHNSPSNFDTLINVLDDKDNPLGLLKDWVDNNLTAQGLIIILGL